MDNNLQKVSRELMHLPAKKREFIFNVILDTGLIKAVGAEDYRMMLRRRKNQALGITKRVFEAILLLSDDEFEQFMRAVLDDN